MHLNKRNNYNSTQSNYGTHNIQFTFYLSTSFHVTILKTDVYLIAYKWYMGAYKFSGRHKVLNCLMPAPNGNEKRLLLGWDIIH